MSSPVFKPNLFRTPLSQPTFYVLLALVRGQQHGYAILSRVVDISQGAVVMKTGTLYPLLKKLVASGLIAELGYERTLRSDLPRLQYELTPHGLILVKSELRRLRHAVRIGEANGLFNDDIPLDIQKLLANLALEE